MFNRQRTLEKFGYDLDLSIRRRTQAEFEATNGINKKDLIVVDNCPSCSVEREIQLRASKKNAPCPKCFHNLPSTILAKQNQTKVKSEQHKQRMKDNHWSKNGYESAFKGQTQTEEAKELIRAATINQHTNETEEEKLNRKIKESCTKRDIQVEDFDGFSSPEGTRIRQSAEGKAWTYDVLAKSNFTCDKCQARGGSLVAHHLNGFNSFPDQRFLPENGICLCEDCHETFHTQFGKGDNTSEQYQEFKTV
ncbi:Nuclease associated modular domain 3 [uncultured Caudovirales phage]|uniref:Nuclease associated modular domain 3 n=1 Tax=uncultured Caudovirales phage TaxID=2100421 RepID=A0A6J5KXR1_9CAUD|nr:Nuclease associated modular domain 3 [uncultured Caudovirales phage]